MNTVGCAGRFHGGSSHEIPTLCSRPGSTPHRLLMRLLRKRPAHRSGHVSDVRPRSPGSPIRRGSRPCSQPCRGLRRLRPHQGRRGRGRSIPGPGRRCRSATPSRGLVPSAPRRGSGAGSDWMIIIFRRHHGPLVDMFGQGALFAIINPRDPLLRSCPFPIALWHRLPVPSIA